MGIATAVTYVNSRGTLEEIIGQEKNQIVNLTLTNIASWLKNRKLELQYWGKQDIFSVAIEGSFHKVANKELAGLKKDYEFYETISVAGPAGAVVVSSDPDSIAGQNVGDQEFFKQALAGQVFISDIVKGRGGNPTFIIAAPVAKDEMTSGVIFGVVDVGFLTRTFIADVKIGKTGILFVMNRDGLVFSHPDPAIVMNTNLSTFDFGRRMLQQKTGTVQYVVDGHTKTAVFKEYPEIGWIIATSADRAETLAPGTRLGYINGAIALCIVLCAVALIFFLAQSIINPVNRVIASLSESSDQITSSSAQVAAASQSFAQSASEQASTIEETSASLEELSSMSNTNAESAIQVLSLAREASTAVTNGSASMQKLTSTMDGIRKSSAEVAKVAKVIEEIAFQTNLLALNAAVEAARAGEAGKGFAVVAEEVRNLAQRAAAQARTTSQLIADSTTRTKDGVRQADDANRELESIFTGIKKVTDLINAISAASREQAQGVGQISTAVMDMEKIVQQNSASAEQTASASQEMSAQARDLKGLVARLLEIVSGAAAADGMQGSGGGGDEESPALVDFDSLQKLPSARL